LATSFFGRVWHSLATASAFSSSLRSALHVLGESFDFHLFIGQFLNIDFDGTHSDLPHGADAPLPVGQLDVPVDTPAKQRAREDTLLFHLRGEFVDAVFVVYFARVEPVGLNLVEQDFFHYGFLL
jgi:hypothetical protein